MSAPLNLSVVVPLYNEEESLPHLVEQLLSALRPTDETFELVLVDDGSSDRTAKVLAEVSAEVPEVVAVLLRKNYGQTAAMAAGVDVAGGEVIVSLDGDLLFFGTQRRCTHVGRHLGEGRYRHSSGQDHGRNGIGIDSLHSSDHHQVACHYRAEFRGAGRVVRCPDGSHLS